MALHGKIIQVGKGYGFEFVDAHNSEPKITRHVWLINEWRCSGMSWCQESDAIDKAATITDGKVSCYLGHGNYFTGFLKNGGSTKAIVVETTDAPRPKVRANTETRWQNGRWQKYSKREGWIAA